MGKTYDLSLGNFGPYNKQYYGACHIADPKKGISFNIEMFPGFFRRSVLAGNSKSDTGIKLWGANAPLTRFVYRYELEWKDRIYCDVDYNITDDSQADICCRFVNNTDLPQSLDIALAVSLQLPVDMPGAEIVGFQKFSKAILPENTVCIDATEHSDICCATAIAPDGKMLGEEVQNGATGLGTVIDGRHFYSPEHFIKYETDVFSSKVGIRYRCDKDTALMISANGVSYNLPLTAATDFQYAVVDIDPVLIKDLVIFATGEPVCVDCICLGEDVGSVRFEPIPHDLIPEKEMFDDHMILRYKDAPLPYTVKWQEGIRLSRQCYCADIGKMLQLTVNNHVTPVVRGIGEGYYEVLLSTPVYLAPGESQERHFRVFAGEEKTPVYHEVEHIRHTPEGEKYAFSQDMMRYNTLLNVVYPIYTRRQYIKHNTPGRFWNCLYAWDSGFIGMGLACSDFTRGFDCLNTYLTPVGDRHSPYIFHGSVVPTQIFLYKHLLDTFPDKADTLKTLYPMIKQYYNFYARLEYGKEQMSSGITKTWHLFYSSGGWDDYPPQDFLRYAAQRGEHATHQNTTPVITTAYTVLISGIMKQIAGILGYDEDIAYYEEVRERYAARIPCLWDEEVGYFSYMIHNEQGQPDAFLRYKDGTNYNMGMDGITPFIADACTETQAQRILGNIKEGLMTDIGICVVDKRAPYYSAYGYWNGSVWMPHQWILWKALIDRGETELCLEIAQKALDVWASEVDASYNCFENFMCHNGRGSGYHHFSGLSCPVSLFYHAYYVPGTVSAGWNATVTQTDSDNAGFLRSVSVRAEKDGTGLIICVGKAATFAINGKPVTARQMTNGTYSLTLQKGTNHISIKTDL